MAVESLPSRRKTGLALKTVGVEWVGKFKDRAVPGATVGLRLYSGKKRMFKGHKWQRQLEARKNKIKARVRDMPKRIQQFKTVSSTVPTHLHVVH